MNILHVIVLLCHLHYDIHRVLSWETDDLVYGFAPVIASERDEVLAHCDACDDNGRPTGDDSIINESLVAKLF